jgi:protein TonB
MTEAGFFAQKNNSPSSLALVLLLHGAVLAAVIMIKGPAFERLIRTPTVVTFIEPSADPPPVPPPPSTEQPQQPQTHIDQVTREVLTDNSGQQVSQGEQVTRFAENIGTGDIVVPPPPPPPPPLPVRRGAQVDPRYAGDLQPPYPPSEQRAQRGGRVQVRVTIGPDGRVMAIALLSATSDAFWHATQQHALRRWRFRPATLDGRPVQESKVMTLVFRIEDAG